MTETPSFNDQLAVEALGLPAGMPPLKPLVSLDRRDRANLLRGMATILPRAESLMPAAPPDDPDAPAATAGRPAWAAYAGKLGVTAAKSHSKKQIQQAVAEHRSAFVSMTTSERLTYEADILELAADMEDLLVVVAEDPTQARAWAKTVSAMDVVNAFFQWNRGAQPGEASRSSS
jgi:hypothetical protein